MDLASIRMITDDLERVVQFYEQVTGVAAIRYTPVFAELIMPSCTLAIGHTQTTPLFGTDSARPADNHTVIIEFRVEDVDGEHKRLKPLVSDWHRFAAIWHRHRGLELHENPRVASVVRASDIPTGHGGRTGEQRY